MADAHAHAKLGDVIGSLVDRSREADEEITIGEVLDQLGTRSHGPLLLGPALLSLLPVVGAIPGVSIVTGTLIVLISVQMVIGREQPWLPKRLLAISLPAKKLTGVLERSQRWVGPIDRVVRRRYPWLTRPPVLQILALDLALLGMSFYPTAFIPWGVTPPSLAATLLALAITARDGLLAAGGLLVSLASVVVLVWFWPF